MRPRLPTPPFLQQRSKQFLAVTLVMAFILSACSTAGVPLEAKVLEPVMNANVKVGDSIKISGRATGANVKKLELHINGAMYAAVDQPAKDSEYDINVDYQPLQAVTTIILVKGINDKNETIVTSDPVFVNVSGSATAPTALPPQPTQAALPTQPLPATAAPAVTAAPGDAVATPALPATAGAAVPTTAAAATSAGAPASTGGASVAPSGEFANLRTGPGVNYDRVGQINTGQTAPVKGKNTDGTWFQVAFADAPGGVAWVFNEVVKFSGDASKLTVQQAPPAPTAAPQAAVQPVPTQNAQVVPLATTAAAAPTAPAPNVPPSALLPYQQSDLFFEPENHLDYIPLRPGAQTNATLTVNGATKLEIQIDGIPPPGIYDCPAGQTSAVTPQEAAGKRVSLPVPQPRYPFSISQRGYYLVTIFVTKLDGTTTTIPRGIVVDCNKKPGA